MGEPGLEAGLAWADIVACQQAVLRFTAAFDMNDLARMLAEFAPDGVWRRQDGVVVGHEGISGMMRERPPGLFVRHVITNLVVVAAGAGATCSSYVTVYRDDAGGAPPMRLGPPSLVGRYQDGLSRHGDAWLLSSRSVSVDFKS